MNQFVKQGILGAVLLGLFALAVYLNRGEAVAEGGISRKEALRRYGFYLTESSAACGIDFRHESPTLDPKLAHIMPIVAGMGAGASVVDFDRDGLPDIYVINSGEGSKNRLYRNKGDGTFEEVAERLGIADLNQPKTGVCMGAVWGD